MNRYMITITLLGGPRDGTEYTIEDDRWRCEYFRVRDSIQSVRFDFSASSLPSTVSPKILTYKRVKYSQGWTCLFLDWDSHIKHVPAAMSEYKWVFEGYKW